MLLTENSGFKSTKQADFVLLTKRPVIYETKNKGNVSLDDGPFCFIQSLELETVLQSCCLVEYEVISCRVWILEEVSYALELNCDA